MLQIIVWLGCLYLVLKGMQLLQVGLTAPNENATAQTLGYLGIILGVGGAILFFWLANEQVNQSSPALESLSSLTKRVPTLSEEDEAAANAMAEEAIRGAEAAADASMKAADAAVRGTK